MPFVGSECPSQEFDGGVITSFTLHLIQLPDPYSESWDLLRDQLTPCEDSTAVKLFIGGFSGQCFTISVDEYVHWLREHCKEAA